MSTSERMTAEEASQALGISKATLYAYVSRGLIKSSPAGRGRQKLYSRAEIEGMGKRNRLGSPPPSVGNASFSSSISRVEGDDLFYRNHSALELSESATFESVSELLLGHNALGEAASARFADLLRDNPEISETIADDKALVRDKLMRIISSHLTAHPLNLNRSETSICTCAGVLLKLGVMCVSKTQRVPEGLFHEQICSSLGISGKREMNMVRRAMILCMDHGFSISTTIARYVASSDASIFHAHLAAIASFCGHNHGGRLDRLMLWLEPLDQLPLDKFRDAVQERLNAGSRPPGFTHPIHGDRAEDPYIDIRAAEMVESLEKEFGDSVAVQKMSALCQIMLLLDNHPSIDIPLVFMTQAFGRTTRLYEVIFLLSRVVGWTAHYLEQKQSETSLRPHLELSDTRGQL